jgi:hypothetical protein
MYSDVYVKAQRKADQLTESTRSEPRQQFGLAFVRLLIVSAFLEDGLRMIFRWSEEKDRFQRDWEVGPLLAAILVGFFCVAQLVGSVMIVFR